MSDDKPPGLTQRISQQIRDELSKEEPTTAQAIVKAASADNGVCIRKIADLAILLTGLWMLIQNGNHGWTPWVLISIAGSDLGIQSVALVLKTYMKK